MTDKNFENQKILVTGGAGFVGSNLVRSLVSKNAKVTVIDNFHPDYGANIYNFNGIEDRIELVRGDITDLALMKKLAQDKNLFFHIAAQCSHVDSMIDPWTDLDFNCKGTLSLLEAVKSAGTYAPVIYAGTRAIIGAPLELPAKESTLPNPVDVYGVNKHAAELYGAVYSRVHKIPFVSIRLTNSYGPLHQMKNGKYGILNWFISLALQNKPIKIFGTGDQLRDYLYIDDAIEAFEKCARFSFKLKAGEKKFSKVQLSGENIPYAAFNIGSGIGMKFADCAKKIVAHTKSPLEFVPWPADRAAIETGDFISDGAASKEYLGWGPKTDFESGLAKTISYYKENLKHYL